MIGDVTASPSSSSSTWMPTFASANSGTMTKPVQGWSLCWSRSFAEMAEATLRCASRASSGVGCSRNERVSSVTRSRSLRAGGYALVTSPAASPAITGSTPDLWSAAQSARPSPRAAGVRQVAGAYLSATRAAKSAEGDRERQERDVLGVDRRDHEQRHEVVDHHDREQADAEPRGPGRHQGEYAEGEGRVRGHGGPPAARAGPAGVEGQVDRDGHEHAAGRRDQGDRHPAPLAELAHVELALGLQPDHEEEEGHQPLVDPVPEIHARCRRRRGGSRAACPRPTRMTPPGRVRPQERGDGGAEERDGAGGLRAEEVPDGGREVAGPRGAAGVLGIHRPRDCGRRGLPRSADGRAPLRVEQRVSAVSSSGRANRKPCPSGQPSMRRVSRCTGSSIPSATSRSPRLLASSMIPRTRAGSPSGSPKLLDERARDLETVDRQAPGG